MSGDVVRSDNYIPSNQKQHGAYYTPDDVVRALIGWAVHAESDRLLDPSCGDGRFITTHAKSVGIEQDPKSAAVAMQRAPAALVHEGDFFTWATNTPERFECAAGNPPFIRYQLFKGDMRRRALDLCGRLGAPFSGLSSSWPLFLVATASLLKPGGRMAFVVPAEIGHAPYSAPLVDYLVEHFEQVQVVAIRDKLFPELSEDCWLLYAEGFGGCTAAIEFTIMERFAYSKTPPRSMSIPVADWRGVWNRRLRPFLLSSQARALYSTLVCAEDTRRLGEVASIGIGYVSGSNNFFHLRPSEAKRWGIPGALLHPSVRNGRALPALRLTKSVVDKWKGEDAAILLLRLSKDQELPAAVKRHLESEDARVAQEAYKCRVRDPWYVVPDVKVPDLFLTYMSGRRVGFVRNDAGCTCTNTLHTVQLRAQCALPALLEFQESPFFQLSCELEGHPLGGACSSSSPAKQTGSSCLPRRLAPRPIRPLPSRPLRPCRPGGTMPLSLDGPMVCQWIGANAALEHFASYTGSTQSQQHIKPLHWYVACRLVLEGGFLPEEITPRPPFTWKKRGREDWLSFDPSVATGAESTVLGGLKTKNVDVVVTKPGLGPVMAVSVKGTIGAFRNLTNRMEEAVGDCTNLHITYPAMVAGFVSVLRANQKQEEAAEEIEPESAPPARQLSANDIAIQKGGAPVETIIRYHTAMRELTGRRGIRDDVSRYEAVAMALVESNTSAPGTVLKDFPPGDSLLRFERFFDALYLRYDERYVYAAPDLKSVTRRREWAESSPVFANLEHSATMAALGYPPRIAGE